MNDDKLRPLLDRAFALSEEELAQMEAEAARGNSGRAADILRRATDSSGLADPLRPRTDFERENPHYHVLDTLRNPDYFPLTCRLLYGIELAPFQHAILKVLWRKPMVILTASRGTSKSFTLALYSHLRLLFTPGSKICLVGAAFRQSKVIFDYMEQMWHNAPVLRDLVGQGTSRRNGPHRDVDRCDLVIGDGVATAIPVGHDGSKVRGMRANYILADEFASIDEEVFNNVIFGFASVSANPVRQAGDHRRMRVAKAVGAWGAGDEAAHAAAARSNQVVLSGTADYAYGQFAKTYRRFRAIAYSRGDRARLAELFPEGVPAGFDHRDYACVRLPVELLPPKYMDEKIIGSAQVKLSRSQFLREYGACYPDDSTGFFKRSLIDSCVVGRPSAPVLSAGREIIFHPAMWGDPRSRHVIAVDPASEQDKLAVVVLALCGDHRRVVHAWTTDRKDHVARKELGQRVEGDYYRFVGHKIRSLMARFPCERLAVDGQGGGVAVLEVLANPTDPADRPLYPLRDPPGTANRKATDHKDGLHVVEVVQFARADWVSAANHGLKADLEARRLLFPLWDAASEEFALESDKQAGRVRMDGDREVRTEDTLLDVAFDIEELKNEMTSIVHTLLPSGRERWDVPEVKLEGGRKGRMRKDRYSALLMANAAAREVAASDPGAPYEAVGGYKGAAAKTDGPQPLYARRPGWYRETDFRPARRPGYPRP